MAQELDTVDEHVKKAAELGFDLTKQFLTLAFAGIAFVVGLSFNTPEAVSSAMLWLVIAAFGVSALLGLVFIMQGIGLLSVKKSYDIYDAKLRRLSVGQIFFMLIGAIFLGAILKEHRPTKKSLATPSVEIRLDAEHSMAYPIDLSKVSVITIDGGKIKIVSTP